MSNDFELEDKVDASLSWIVEVLKIAMQTPHGENSIYYLYENNCAICTACKPEFVASTMSINKRV